MSCAKRYFRLEQARILGSLPIIPCEVSVEAEKSMDVTHSVMLITIGYQGRLQKASYPTVKCHSPSRKP